MVPDSFSNLHFILMLFCFTCKACSEENLEVRNWCDNQRTLSCVYRQKDSPSLGVCTNPTFFPAAWGPIDAKLNCWSYLFPWAYFHKRRCTAGNTRFRVVHRVTSTHASVRYRPSFLDISTLAEALHVTAVSFAGYRPKALLSPVLITAHQRANFAYSGSLFATKFIKATQPDREGKEELYGVTTLSKAWLQREGNSTTTKSSMICN